MRIVSLIPARGGSKSIPFKNIARLGNHPLIAYSIAISKMSSLIESEFISTNSEDIADVAKNYGAHVPFLRPEEISGDKALDIDFFRHFIDYFQLAGKEVPELIVHLRPTTPFREVAVVDAAIQYMIDNPEATALRTAAKTDLTPYKIFRKNGEYMYPFMDYEGEEEFSNLPRQVFEPAYIPNGYVDVVRTETLLNTGMLHGKKIKLWETDVVADIDCIDDLIFAKKIQTNPAFKPLFHYVKEIDYG